MVDLVYLFMRPLLSAFLLVLLVVAVLVYLRLRSIDRNLDRIADTLELQRRAWSNDPRNKPEPLPSSARSAPVSIPTSAFGR